jgi:hypothetical protein
VPACLAFLAINEVVTGIGRRASRLWEGSISPFG